MRRLGKLVTRLDRAQWAYSLFVILIVFQGFHELEHVVQLVQVFALSIANGKGIVGSFVDIEPVHFAYNSIFLTLLIGTYLVLGLHREHARRVGIRVFGLLTFAVVAQTWHEAEHVAKIVEYFQLGHRNGTGGILGIGRGAIYPTFNLVLLHFAYNTVAFTSAFLAFLRLGFHRPVLNGLEELRTTWSGQRFRGASGGRFIDGPGI
jgi:hypothetical protein